MSKDNGYINEDFTRNSFMIFYNFYDLEGIYYEELTYVSKIWPSMSQTCVRVLYHHIC